MSERAPSEWSKLDRIKYLLDQWDAIYDPNTTSPVGAPGDGAGIPLLPKMAHHPSVVELGRCLALLENFAPVQFRHVKAYHCGAEWRIRTDQVRKRRPSGKGFEMVEVRRRDRIYPRWIRGEKVRSGEDFLAARFRGDVFIPSELWDALHTPAVAA